jgi:hypothetical protein
VLLTPLTEDGEISKQALFTALDRCSGEVAVSRRVLAELLRSAGYEVVFEGQFRDHPCRRVVLEWIVDRNTDYEGALRSKGNKPRDMVVQGQHEHAIRSRCADTLRMLNGNPRHSSHRAVLFEPDDEHVRVFVGILEGANGPEMRAAFNVAYKQVHGRRLHSGPAVDGPGMGPLDLEDVEVDSEDLEDDNDEKGAKEQGASVTVVGHYPANASLRTERAGRRKRKSMDSDVVEKTTARMSRVVIDLLASGPGHGEGGVAGALEDNCSELLLKRLLKDDVERYGVDKTTFLDIGSGDGVMLKRAIR